MINQAIAAYTPIGLEALNDKAEMLERLDNKYILATDRVLPTLQALKGAFDILQIDDKRAFTYSTRYFDDEELSTITTTSSVGANAARCACANMLIQGSAFWRSS